VPDRRIERKRNAEREREQRGDDLPDQERVALIERQPDGEAGAARIAPCSNAKMGSKTSPKRSSGLAAVARVSFSSSQAGRRQFHPN
jgi:hypothetical protein